MDGPIPPEPPPPPEAPPKPALDSQRAKPVLLLVSLATVLSMGLTFANCTLETGGGKGPATRISPTWVSIENALPILLVVAGVALAIVHRERGAGFIALALGLPFFVAGVGFTLMTFSPGSILMHRRGRFHSNRDSARIVWIDGEITHNSIPLKDGNAYCKDWL